MKTVRNLFSLFLLSLMLVLGMSAAAHADGWSYVYRWWDGSAVRQETRTVSNYRTIKEDTETISGWYVVNGYIETKKRLVVEGTANIVIVDGSTLEVGDGINVRSGHTLNIYGQRDGTGTLKCIADTSDNAAIGSDDEKGTCGTINIYGATVIADAASKGTDGAGIGGGDSGSGGNVTIYGGNVTAKGGKYAAGIGGGDDDGARTNGGTFKMYGGTVKANGGTDAAGIGGGEGGSGGTVLIYGGTVEAEAGVVDQEGGAGIGSGERDGHDYVKAGTVKIYGGTVKAKGQVDGAGIGGGDEIPGDIIEIHGGKVIAYGGICGAGIGGGDNNDGGWIWITGGTIEAHGGTFSAAIGGGDGGPSGTIIIDNCESIEAYGVEAYGNGCGAGIGGGDGAGVTAIHINGGKSIKAVGGKRGGAGIGAGSGAGTATYNGGTITIAGGNIEATGKGGGAGIGAGDGGTSYTIKIRGGKIVAKGEDGGAGIGGGDKNTRSSGGSITIGGTADIEATGGTNAAGIGGGDYTDGGTITIEGGTVTATGNGGGAGIGGGEWADSGSITIKGGVIRMAKSNGNGMGIGAGWNQDFSGTIKFEGGDVTATRLGKSDKGELKKGSVHFNGGTVHLYPNRQTAISADTISFNDTPQFVVYTESENGKARYAVGAERASTLRSSGKYLLEVLTGDAPKPTRLSYMDWDGTKLVEKAGDDGCADAEPVSAGTTAFADGKWYAVTGNTTVNERITVNGTAHLILCDGAKLTAAQGICVNEGNHLIIHGQSGGTGTLEASVEGWARCAGIGGDADVTGGQLTVNGGVITARSTVYAAGIGGGGSGNGGIVTVNGGKITAIGGIDAAGIGGGDEAKNGGSFTLNGGTVIASGSGSGNGRAAGISGTIKLDAGVTVWAGESENPRVTGSIAGDFAKNHSQRYVYMTNAEPVITGYDLVLDGALKLRFYVYLPADFRDESAHMDFTIRGRSYTQSIADAERIDGRAVFSCPVYSIEMAEPVTAIFHSGSTSTLAWTATVKQYLDMLDANLDNLGLSEGDIAKLRDLIAATRNYGHYMQTYLAGVHHFTVGDGEGSMYYAMPKASDITPLTALPEYKRTWGPNRYDPEVIESMQYFDDFDADTTLNIDLTLKSSPASVTAKVDGKDWTVRNLGGSAYRITIPNIAANNLGKAFHVELTADNDVVYDANLSALSYVSAVLDAKRDQPGEPEALTAFYEYYQAAKAFE